MPSFSDIYVGMWNLPYWNKELYLRNIIIIKEYYYYLHFETHLIPFADYCLTFQNFPPICSLQGLSLMVIIYFVALFP